MNKITYILEEYIEPTMERVEENQILISIRSGSIYATPFIILGSLITLLVNFPGISIFFPDVSQWMQNYLTPLLDCTYGVSALVMMIGVVSIYAKEKEVDRIFATITAILAYVILTIYPGSSEANTQMSGIVEMVNTSYYISLDVFGFKAIILAIMTSLVSVKIFSLFYKSNKNQSNLYGKIFTFDIYKVILPISMTLIFFVLLKEICISITSQSVIDFVYSMITTPMLVIGKNIFSFIFVTQICANFLWFFGIHGTNVVNAVWDPILQTLSMSNLIAFQSGQDIPSIISSTFQNVYGITNVYCILIALILVARSKRLKKTYKMSLVPALFCISEPMLFGIPIFINPVLFVPYILCSSIQFIVAYILCYIGFAPVPILPVPWTTPIFINVLISSEWNFYGVLTQIILLIIGVIIWYPFLKILDRRYLCDENA